MAQSGYQYQILEVKEEPPYNNPKHVCKMDKEPINPTIVYDSFGDYKPPLSPLQDAQPPQGHLIFNLRMLSIAGDDQAQETLNEFETTDPTPRLWLMARQGDDEHRDAQLAYLVELLVAGAMRGYRSVFGLSISSDILRCIVDSILVWNEWIRTDVNMLLPPSVQVGDWWTQLHPDWTDLEKVEAIHKACSHFLDYRRIDLVHPWRWDQHGNWIDPDPDADEVEPQFQLVKYSQDRPQIKTDDKNKDTEEDVVIKGSKDDQ